MSQQTRQDRAAAMRECVRDLGYSLSVLDMYDARLAANPGDALQRHYRQRAEQGLRYRAPALTEPIRAAVARRDIGWTDVDAAVHVGVTEWPGDNVWAAFRLALVIAYPDRVGELL